MDASMDPPATPRQVLTRLHLTLTTTFESSDIFIVETVCRYHHVNVFSHLETRGKCLKPIDTMAKTALKYELKPQFYSTTTDLGWADLKRIPALRQK